MFDLGLMPLVNNLHDTAEEARQSARYPLRVMMDQDLTAHLDYQVPPAELYASYLYRSSVNAPYAAHCRRMWQEVAPLKPRRVIDVGGNDGTLLQAFQSQSGYALELVNVDASASVGPENLAKGINYVNAYWGDVDVGKADVITSTNVFQHTADVGRFLRGIQQHLDGVWILEFPYFLNTLKTQQFDQIYHEHYYYWLITPLIELFRAHGLTIIKVSEVESHGGSLRVVSTNRRVEATSDLAQFVSDEAAYDYPGWGEGMSRRIAADSARFDSLVGVATAKGKTIAAFGAAAKGCIYINAVGCHRHLMYVVDDTPQKQGKFVPGTSLQVVPREQLFADQPDILLILAHNFRDYIASSLRPHFKGEIITMVPHPEVLSPGSDEWRPASIRSNPCCS